MLIKLYTMNDEMIKVDKTLESEIILGGTLRDGSNLITPVFRYESAVGVSSNYAYIPEFGRYYFIKSISVIRNNFYEIGLEIDVLKTYATEIRALTCILKRQEYKNNMYLDDPEFKAYTYNRIQTKEFPNGFLDTPKFILTVAGGA